MEIILEEKYLSTLFQALYMELETFFLVEKKVLVLEREVKQLFMSQKQS